MTSPIEPVEPVETVEPTEPIEPTAPAAAVSSKKKLGRGPLIAIIAGGLVLLLGLGAALVNVLLGGAQSASASAVAFPKNTLYWAEFAIEPSTSQLTEAFRFYNEFDALQDVLEDADLDIDLDDPSSYNDFKKSLWEFLVEGDDSSIDTNLDYDDDIAPWIGSRVSIGLLPGDDLEDPPLIIAIEARDTAAGIEAVEELVSDLDVDADVEARNGYVIVATGDVDIDSAYEDGTLDKAENFGQASAAAGGWGVASVYVDLGAVYALVSEATTADYDSVDYWKTEIENNYYLYVDESAYESVEVCPEGEYEYYECTYSYVYDGKYYEYYDEFAMVWVEDNSDELAEQKVEEFKDYADQQQALVDSLEGTTAFVVARFVDASFEVSGVVSGVKDMVMAPGTGDDGSGLPASTIALISLAGLAETLDSSLSDENLSLSGNSLGMFSPYSTGGPTSLTREDVELWFDETLGIDFPDDLTDLFGSKIQLVLDSDIDFSDLEDTPTPSAAGDIAESGAALVITTDDADATVDAWQDLLELAEESAGDDLGIEVEQDGDRVVVSGGDYLETVLNPDERLGDIEAFRRAVPQRDGSSSMIYIDVAQLVDLYDDLSGAGGALDVLDGMQAFGLTTRPLSDDSYSFVLRVTTEAE